MKTADRALFGELIDYAGLFPPASLDLGAAIAEYRGARTGPYQWLLGRFIIRASQLQDLGGRLMASMRAGEQPWAISAILDGEVGAASVRVQEFDAEMEPAAQVALIEVPLPDVVGDGRSVVRATEDAAETVTAALAASPTAPPFFEVVRTEAGTTGMANALEALAAHRSAAHRPVGAKLRCGGLEPSAFPTAAEVAAFITGCVEHQLPFKATAGLHHPVRHEDLQLGVKRHGFLNLLVAGAIARTGAPPEEVEAAVASEDADAFKMSAAGLSWQGHTVRVGAISALRSQFAGYGSCSFAEPVADLIGLGMLKEVS